jgi:hypothetical protein
VNLQVFGVLRGEDERIDQVERRADGENQGRLRPADEVVAFPRMSAMQGERRGESQADAALLP